jgi:hypothetical protein
MVTAMISGKEFASPKLKTAEKQKPERFNAYTEGKIMQSL